MVYIIALGVVALLVGGLLVFGLVKLFLKASKIQRILLSIVIALCIAWWLPIGSLTGTWQLSSGFSANPIHIRPAPQSMQFNSDGTGIKVDHEGYELSFEWRITDFGELNMSTRPHSFYMIRFRGFGTRMSLEDSLRGERTIGRFDTQRDFTANFRRRFRS